MKGLSVLTLAVLVTLLFGACSSTARGPLRLYQRHSGDIVNMHVGETVEVVLDGRPGTDIHWITPPDDLGILEQVGGTDYVTDLETYSAEQRLTVRFKAVAPGRTRLQLSYRDPAVESRDRVFDVWVVVEEAG